MQQNFDIDVHVIKRMLPRMLLLPLLVLKMTMMGILTTDDVAASAAANKMITDEI